MIQGKLITWWRYFVLTSVLFLLLGQFLGKLVEILGIFRIAICIEVISQTALVWLFRKFGIGKSLLFLSALFVGTKIIHCHWPKRVASLKFCAKHYIIFSISRYYSYAVMFILTRIWSWISFFLQIFHVNRYKSKEKLNELRFEHMHYCSHTWKFKFNTLVQNSIYLKNSYSFTARPMSHYTCNDVERHFSCFIFRITLLVTYGKGCGCWET